MSARPMDQMSIPPSSDLKSDNGVSTPHEDHYNNSSEKPIVTPRDSVKPTALENKRPPKSAAPSPPKKPTPYVSKMDRKSIKLSDSAAGVKPIPDSGRTTKTKNSKTDSSFSIFYVDSIADSSSKQDDQNQVISGKTGNERLSGEIGGKSVSKENDKLKPDIQVNRKSKNKEERIKKPAETESTVTSKQHETTVLKPKVKPTIITAKKPKKTRTVDNSDEKTGNRASLNGKSLLEDSNSLANSVQPLRELNKPGRPNCPPSTTVEEHQSDTTQPQRPKAPPNTVQEDQKYSGKVKKKNDEQKVSKHQQLTQGKSKAKPPRPPMAKEGAKIKPVRSAPAQPNVERYVTSPLILNRKLNRSMHGNVLQKWHILGNTLSLFTKK